MEISIYNNLIKIQNECIEFINGQETSQTDFQSNVFDYLEDIKNEKKKAELTQIINLMLNIFNNHHRTINYFQKIETIIILLKQDIQEFFSNEEIFNIFSSNERILIFLIKEQIIKIDENIIQNIIESLNQFYFIPEIIKFSNIKMHEIDETFEEKRQKAENDGFICQLIQNDSIEKFIAYVNKNNLSLNATIKQSIFETNPFLIGKTPSLIEYALFFGSIQIVKYLFMNKVNLTPSLWLYTIHSNNPELIHFLEENHVEPEDATYKQCLSEAIKCHHNDIANYIRDNLLGENIDLLSIVFQYSNYALFDGYIRYLNICYLYQNNARFLVKLLLENNGDVDVNKEVVLQICFVLNIVSISKDLIQFIFKNF